MINIKFMFISDKLLNIKVQVIKKQVKTVANHRYNSLAFTEDAKSTRSTLEHYHLLYNVQLNTNISYSVLQVIDIVLLNPSENPAKMTLLLVFFVSLILQ